MSLNKKIQTETVIIAILSLTVIILIISNYYFSYILKTRNEKFKDFWRDYLEIRSELHEAKIELFKMKFQSERDQLQQPRPNNDPNN